MILLRLLKGSTSLVLTAAHEPPPSGGGTRPARWSAMPAASITNYTMSTDLQIWGATQSTHEDEDQNQLLHRPCQSSNKKLPAVSMDCSILKFNFACHHTNTILLATFFFHMDIFGSAWCFLLINNLFYMKCIIYYILVNINK